MTSAIAGVVLNKLNNQANWEAGGSRVCGSRGPQMVDISIAEGSVRVLLRPEFLGPFSGYLLRSTPNCKDYVH